MQPEVRRLAVEALHPLQIESLDGARLFLQDPHAKQLACVPLGFGPEGGGGCLAIVSLTHFGRRRPPERQQFIPKHGGRFLKVGKFS